MGLPDRDYYTRTDSGSVALRTKYVAHVAKMLELLGEPTADAEKDAHRAMDIETRLAKASLTRVQRRDPVANYHKMGVADLDTLMPGFNWKAFLTAQGRPDVNTFDVNSPMFMKTVNDLLTSVPSLASGSYGPPLWIAWVGLFFAVFADRHIRGPKDSYAGEVRKLFVSLRSRISRERVSKKKRERQARRVRARKRAARVAGTSARPYKLGGNSDD